MSERHDHAVSHMPTSGTGIAVCECGATMRVVMGKSTEPWHSCRLCCITYDGAMPGTPDVIKHHFCAPKMELLTMDDKSPLSQQAKKGADE